MPFHFKRKESVANAVRRLGGGRAGGALESLRRGDGLEGVHQARKEIKKLRAILRLARGGMSKAIYRKNAKDLRAAANCLTAMRDAQARVAAFEKLIRHFRRELSARPFPKIRKALHENYRAEERNFLKGNSIAVANRILRKSKRRAGDLKIRRDGWAAIGPGLNKSYRRGRKALEAVGGEPSAENFHEWRKRVKDLWHHLRLLRPIRPKELRAAADELDLPGKFLGEDHDLTLLKTFAASRFNRAGDAENLDRLIDSRQRELRLAALKSGAGFFAEKPPAFCRRFENDWKIWRGEK